VLLLVSLTCATGAFGTALAGAQTTTTTPPTTQPVTTTIGGTTATTGAGDTTGTAASDDSGSDIPWVPIAIAVAVVLVIIVLLVLLSRRRRRRIAAREWRASAADATAEIGATARLLSSGNPATRAVAEQILTSLRAFDGLAATAPDGAGREAAQRGRRIVQALGRAIDTDHSVRRAQPPASADRIEGSAEMLRSTAADSDRALRALYRGFTETN
jgi:hypothetical protein